MGQGCYIPYSFNSVQWHQRVTEWAHYRVSSTFVPKSNFGWHVWILHLSLIYTLTSLYRFRWIGCSSKILTFHILLSTVCSKLPNTMHYSPSICTCMFTYPADLIWLQKLLVLYTNSSPVPASGANTSCSNLMQSLVGNNGSPLWKQRWYF